MKQILNLIRRYMGCCLNCGSFQPKTGCLCRPCENALQLWEKSVDQEAFKGLSLRTLYRWVPGRSDILSRLILWLKGSQQKEAWHYYAQEMCRRYADSVPDGYKIYVVPAPSRTGHKDHAHLWAEGLSRALGAELLPCLKKSGQYAQRGADRGTRALIEMELIENYTDSVDFASQALWIFADDIVTTGSTARSAHIALGRPAHFQIWALAQRSLSCGASKDLL